MISKSMEEYLRTIYSLNEEGKQAETTEIATRLGIKPSSVTEMLKKLADEGYVIYEAYRGAELTTKGSKTASKIARKHRLLERFLTDILKLGKNNIHDQACAMEHTLSDEAEEALCRVLKQPDRCPDDEKTIPPCDKDVPSCIVCDEVPAANEREETIIPLSNLTEGQEGLVTFIRGGRRACQRLADLGLTKDTPVKIVNSAPFHGPVEISVRETKIAVGRRLATRIFVRVR
jgi:DtxR family Mn-dependent transcriptional regulator